MSDKKLIFFVRAFNDLDHFSAVANIYLENSCRVHFYISNRDLDKADFRLKILQEYPSFSVQYLELLDLKIFSGKKTSKIYQRILLDYKNLRRILTVLLAFPIFCYYLGAFIKIYKSDAVFVDWSTPYSRGIVQGLLVKFAKTLSKRVNAIPHGVNIYSNNDVTDSYYFAHLKNKSFNFMRFDQRNWYSTYGVQYSDKKKLWEQCGATNLSVLGSPRFFQNWRNKIVEEFKNLEIKSYTNVFREGQPDKKLNVLFFDHQKDYRIRKANIIELHKEIASLPFVNYVIKPSTREHKSYYSLHETLELERLGCLFDSRNSILLIRNADVVINFGSSILLEAIAFKVPVINPIFCHYNSTFVESYVPSATARSIKDVLSKLRKINSNQKWFSQNEADAFYKYIVYDNKAEHKMIQRWLEILD